MQLTYASVSAHLIRIALACALLTPAYGQTDSPELAFELSATQRAQLEALQSADEHGLSSTNYDVPALENLASNRTVATADRFNEKLDTAFRRYAMDISQGRLSPLTDPDWHIPPRTASEIEPGTTINAIERLKPPHPDYERLHGAMIHYQAIRKHGGWPMIPAGPTLSTGLLHPHAELARNRLRMTNDYDATAPASSYLFDAGLDEAVRNFQARHGLRVSGVIDDTTRKVMNVPVEDRIQQLAIAMERWRWLPRDLGDEYVWINAAEAMLDIVIDGQPILSMRTIVGHSTRPTPSLQSEIRRIVFNPTWSVPYSIATEDLLPKLRNDREFLTRNGFRVYTGGRDDTREVDPAEIDWTNISANRFPYRFIQQPSPGNSLGRVKIVFDNPYDIYIHDTPSKGLFGLRTRTFSSGCVRLEQATDFANVLLANDGDWSDADTRRVLGDERTRGINLQRRVPIYVVYITSWVSADGQAHFRRDLYRRDAAVMAARLEDGARP